jgi:hypothetical protein
MGKGYQDVLALLLSTFLRVRGDVSYGFTSAITKAFCPDLSIVLLLLLNTISCRSPLVFDMYACLQLSEVITWMTNRSEDAELETQFSVP